MLPKIEKLYLSTTWSPNGNGICFISSFYCLLLNMCNFITFGCSLPRKTWFYSSYFWICLQLFISILFNTIKKLKEKWSSKQVFQKEIQSSKLYFWKFFSFFPHKSSSNYNGKNLQKTTTHPSKNYQVKNITRLSIQTCYTLKMSWSKFKFKQTF